MRFRQVVVVTKFYKADLRLATAPIHRQTLKNVLKWLKAKKIAARLLNRNHLSRAIRGDLIITVGGDGTVLAASHFTDRHPLLAVNSAPQSSTGFFCLAGPKSFPQHLEKILAGKKKPVLVPRMQIRINGKPVPFPVLNDVLFASRPQGETARYRLRAGRREEYQKSSGIWMATGAGSTAAIYSAGGKKDSPFSKRLQYLVREPCRFSGRRYRLLKGFIEPGHPFKIVSEMNQGSIFIDGGRIHYRVKKGDTITVRGGVHPLKIFL